MPLYDAQGVSSRGSSARPADDFRFAPPSDWVAGAPRCPPGAREEQDRATPCKPAPADAETGDENPVTTTDLREQSSARAESPRDRRWLALAVIGVAQLMIILDASIVNIALPHAQAALHISDASRQWALTAYTLTFGGLLLLGGRVADYLGRKRTFLVGLFGFAAASALGGAAQNAGWLFGARALQGVFAAVLAPAVLSLITTTFTEPQRAGEGVRCLRRHLRCRRCHRPDRRRRAHRVPQLALDACWSTPRSRIVVAIAVGPAAEGKPRGG